MPVTETPSELALLELETLSRASPPLRLGACPNPPGGQKPRLHPRIFTPFLYRLRDSDSTFAFSFATQESSPWWVVSVVPFPSLTQDQIRRPEKRPVCEYLGWETKKKRDHIIIIVPEIYVSPESPTPGASAKHDARWPQCRGRTLQSFRFSFYTIT